MLFTAAVGRGPIEVAVSVGYGAVQRRDRGVDQLRHPSNPSYKFALIEHGQGRAPDLLIRSKRVLHALPVLETILTGFGIRPKRRLPVGSRPRRTCTFGSFHPG